MIHLKLPSFWKIYFYIFLIISFSLLISKGGLIRIFSYIGLFALTYFYLKEYFTNSIKLKLKFNKILLIPLAYILLDMIATKSINLNNEHMKLILATSFGVGIFALAKNQIHSIKYLLNSTILLLVLFVTFQVFSIFVLGKLNGTQKNPHYLALYSAYALQIGLFYYFTETRKIKYIIPIVVAILLGLILSTSSRPTWIALFIAAFLCMLFLKDKIKNLALVLIILVPSILFFTNAWNFGGRLKELFINISSEERVVIWSDTWTMQKSSNNLQWLFGNGLDKFEENFKVFSRYHLEGNDFTIPHNSVLEVLYSSGLIGVGLFFIVYFFTSYHLIDIIKKSDKFKSLALLLFSMLIVNFFMGLITIKWFTHLNSYVLTAIIGLTIYIKSYYLQKK